MDRVETIIIADQNNSASRELAQTVQSAAGLNVLHRIFHIDDVGDIRECVRAVPAVGVLLLADDMQEAVELADILRAASLLEARDTAAEIVATRSTDEEALTLPRALYREWTGEGMGAIQAGEIVWLRSNDTLYRCPSGVTVPLSSQPPDGAGMLAVYAPIRPDAGDEAVPWLYGETGLEVGVLRVDPTDGKTYRMYNPAGAGANVHEPHLVPAIWEAVET